MITGPLICPDQLLLFWVVASYCAYQNKTMPQANEPSCQPPQGRTVRSLLPVNGLLSLPTCPSGRVLGVATRGLSVTASMRSFLRPNMVLATCEISLLAFNLIFTRSSLAGSCTSLFMLQRKFFARRE